MNEQNPLEETSNKNIASMIEKKENPPEIKDAKKDFEKMVTYFLSSNPSNIGRAHD